MEPRKKEEKQILRRWLRMTPERIVSLTVILSAAKDLLFPGQLMNVTAK
jgi:hypothetical protein